MTTSNHTGKDFYYLFIIRFPQDCTPLETDFPMSNIESVNFLMSVKPDSLLIRKTNTVVFIPFIEPSIGALLFDSFSKTRKNDYVAFTEPLVGVNFRQKVAVCCCSNLLSLINLLCKKYVPSRLHFSVRYEEVISITNTSSKSLNDCQTHKEEIIDELSEPVVSVKKDWKVAHLVVKHKKCELLQSRHNKKRYLEDTQNEEALSRVKSYFENDHVTQYSKRKQHPSVYMDQKLEPKEMKTNQERATVSLSNATGGSKLWKGFRSPKVPHRIKKKLKSDTEYRKPCPDFSSVKVFMDTKVDREGIFSDPENLEKDVSIKQFFEKDGDLKPEVRKDLREITNLPFRRRPVRRQDIIAFPGGRKKKNERPTERRPQRNQAQDQTSIHAQVNI